MQEKRSFFKIRNKGKFKIWPNSTIFEDTTNHLSENTQIKVRGVLKLSGQSSCHTTLYYYCKFDFDAINLTQSWCILPISYK